MIYKQDLGELAMPFLRNMILITAILLSYSAHASSWPTPPTLEAKSWALIDARSGQVIVDHDANIQLPPASLTKMMTLYLIFEDLKLGRLSLNDQLNVSKKAWKIGGSTMFLEPRMHPKVADLIHGIATFSGNDACIVMAEHLAGSESAFADRMNKRANKLGMKHSHFINATGFPAKGHYSSAMDMAILAAALWRDFPDHYKVFSEKGYTYNGITQPNRNRLLWSMPEVDGLKTGHTKEAGYCLVSSAERNQTRFVSAVFGTTSDKQRAQQSKVLLTHGFRNFITLRPMERDIRRQIDVYGGTEEHVWLKPSNDVWVTVPKGLEEQLNFRLRYDSPMHAPITKGQEIGSIDAVLGKDDSKPVNILVHIPMQAARDVPEASWFGRKWDDLRLWWQERDDEDQPS